MRKSIRTLCSAAAALTFGWSLAGCSSGIEENSAGVINSFYSTVSVSSGLSVSSSISAPFGLVADTSADNVIKLAWGCPSVMPDSWHIYLDGEKVEETSVLKQVEVEAYAGSHVIAVAAVINGNRSEAEGIEVSVTGTAAPAESSNGIVSGATYKILSRCSGKSLDNDNWSKEAGGNVHMWTYGNDQANQQWVVSQNSDGSWVIANLYSGLVLDAANWGTTDGTNVFQWNNVGNQNQHWNISKEGSYYKVINAYSGLALDVSAASKEDGANVQTWTWNGTDAQLWEFVKLSDGEADTGSDDDDTDDTGNENTDNGNIGSGISTSTDDVLVSRNGGMQLTYQFQNCTKGAFSDDEIYIYVICMNSSDVWCYAKPDGSLVPIGNTSSDVWEYTLAEVKNSGFQMPYAHAGRIYYSYGAPLTMYGLSGGVVLPSLSNTADPNYNIYFDWLEFTVASNGFWVNTTQVDQLGFPVLINVYDNDGSVQQTGISASRESIWQSYLAEMPDEFDTLEGTYRIVAPCKAGFDNRTGGAYGNYFDSYVAETWNTIASKSQTVTHPQGKFILTGDGNNLYFRCIEAYGTIASVGTTYTIYGRPSTSEVLEGYGVLASGNAMELALEAWVCAALNRHVAHMTPDTYWNDASYYYNAGPCNYFAKFWHDHSERGGLAYGFCYDDVNDQSATTYTGNVRGVVVRLGF
ncbi:beta-1,3-glucanase family protein [Treponema sp.]|uniref:beta-1,3-glucanase family protein n=1 Tax=Treponema sp. TaxID=166 RepID=UPI0025F4B57F|nr:beta-1,3-glucanase family protein [Treponema sp.]MCR5217267.1 RICIN domain-containing protein [Treponema sp.]